MKKQIGLFLALLILSSVGAADLKEGAFTGKFSDSKEITMVLKEVPGRKGSFFGLFIKDKKVGIYLLDSLQEATYTMTPLQAIGDGEIGIQNDDPSLVLQIISNEIKITSSQSGNQIGFKEYMIFSLKKYSDKWQWSTAVEGHYGKALSIGRFNALESESLAVFTSTKLNGSFALKEKLSKIYTLNPDTRLGAQETKGPRAIGVFLKEKSRGSSKKVIFYLIRPGHDQDAFIFRLGKKRGRSYFSNKNVNNYGGSK